MRATPTLAFALLLLLPSAPGASAPSPRPEKVETLPPPLEAYIESALRDWDVPGAAVAVVKDGRVVVAKGYGLRELGKPERVDANTLFDAASLTKSFTAAMIGTLVDEKRMAWDDPVRRYLPGLEFPDPYLTANVSLRDLLSHRTGVRATDSAWLFTGVSRSRLLELVRNMESAAPFRTRWVYSNVGYTIAGEAAAAVAARTWEQLVTSRLLVPLGMTRSTASYDDAPSLGNVSSGHALVAGVQRAIPRETRRASTSPAGGVQCSAADLARWLLFQLGDGTFEGRRLLSADAMSEMHAPQIVVPTTEAFRSARQVRHFVAYGLGWQVMDFRGNKLLWHSGSGDGQIAYMALLPEHRLGVTVLINTEKVGLLHVALVSRILDHYLGADPRDYSAELREPWAKKQQGSAEDERSLEAARARGTSPGLAVASYVGVFRDRLGLDVVISLRGSALRLQYGGGEGASLTHWHHDTFRVRWDELLHAEQKSTFVSFDASPRGKADRLHLQLAKDEIDARRIEP